MLDKLTLEVFHPLVGTDFIVQGPNGATLPITLTGAESLAKDKSRGIAPDLRVPFSLTFRGPQWPQLAQGTFQLEHPALETEGYFLVPVKSDAQGMQYEAIFS